MTKASANTSLPDRAAIETLLYDEADCLDRADLGAWLELYTEDATYWMPQSPDQTDPNSQISLFYDDRLLMDIRRLNFASPLAPSMAYAVRGSHIIGNIRLGKWDDETNNLTVTSNFHVALLYRNEQTIYAGRYTHELLYVKGNWKIRHKRVDLINCDCPLKSLVIYL